jgi:shikimate dehydrogenase
MPIARLVRSRLLAHNAALLELGERTGAIVVDLAYRGDGAETPLCEAARERGARVVDGIEVLIGQGIYAFELLTGRRAPVEAMRRGARA